MRTKERFSWPAVFIRNDMLSLLFSKAECSLKFPHESVFLLQIEVTCKWRKGPFFVLKSIFVKDLLEFTGQRAKTPKHTSNWHIWDTLRRIGSGNTGKERKKKLLLLIRGHLGVSHLSTLEYSKQKFNHTWELNGEGVPLELSNF